jgi:hypothetical protein
VNSAAPTAPFWYPDRAEPATVRTAPAAPAPPTATARTLWFPVSATYRVAAAGSQARPAGEEKDAARGVALSTDLGQHQGE